MKKATNKNKSKVLISNWVEGLMITLVLFFAFYSEIMMEIQMNTDWMHEIYNNQMHTSIVTWARPTIITFMIMAVLAYLIIRFISTDKWPPFTL